MMREVEEPQFKGLAYSELQARIDLLHRQIADEEKHSSGSRHHIKLLQDYEEAVNIKYIRNMQTNSAACMETIERLEEKLKRYKVMWGEQVEANKKLHAALAKIRSTTDDEIKRAIV
jgi:hypothetical protein